MKKLFPLFLGMACVSTVAARTVEPAEANAIASDFMQMLTPGRVSTLNRTVLKSVSNATPQPYYIYNNPNGGYVIVAGDDRLGSILAYSDNGVIELENAPDGLTGLLGQYAAAYTALQQNPSDYPATAISQTPVPEVHPILNPINWGQDSPFNLMTPTYTSGLKKVNYYTGCVACAATQIMRHYEWPKQGTGSKTYTDPLSKNTLSANFGATQYDWSQMPKVVPNDPTAAQQQAYSTLAAHMGVALEMQYEASGSGTYDMLVPYALRNYFGYDNAVRSHNRAYYSTGEWMQIIKDELQAGRPVFYGGTSDAGTGGHAFVIDGYDSEGLVHVNWGWYGRSNGYFMINHLDPTSLGEGGGAGGYNLNQDMVTGIQPAQPGSERSYSIYGATRLSVDGPFGDALTIMTYIENTDMEPFTGFVDVLLYDADNNLAATLGTTPVTIPGFQKGFAGNLLYNPKDIKPSSAGKLPDGNYTIRLGYKSEQNGQPILLRHPKGLPAYAEAVISRGALSITGKHQPAPDCVLLAPLTTDGDIYAGGNSLVNISVENRSGDYVISEVTLRLTSVKNPDEKYDTTVSHTVYDQSSEDFALLMPVDATVPAGKYNLTALVKNSNGEYLFDNTEVGATTVDILPVSAEPVIRTASQLVWRTATVDSPESINQGEMLYGVISLRNAASSGKTALLVRLVNKATGESFPYIQANVDFTSASTQSVTFGRYIPFDPGTYAIELRQVNTSTFEETPIAATYPVNDLTINTSSDLIAEMVAMDFPTELTQGKRISASMTYRGLDTARQSLYVRVRQFTNSGGELAYMGSQSFTPGTEKTINFGYTPSASLADGLYMLIADTGNSSAQTPLGNYGAYGRVVAIGNVSSAEVIEAENSAVAIWTEGRTLRVQAAGDNSVSNISIYNTAGALVAADTFDLSNLPAAIYIVRVTLGNGNSTTAKITLR